MPRPSSVERSSAGVRRSAQGPRLIGTHHDHIDGSLAMLDIVADLYRLAGREFPFVSTEAWRDFMRDPRRNIVERFATVTQVLQTREALRLAGYAYGRRRAAEGLKYCEAKFAPQFHLGQGMDPIQAINAVYDGLRAAENEFGIRLFLVASIGREAAPEIGVMIAKAVLAFDGEVALDLACDEAHGPPEKHLPAFQLTFGTKVRRDCHAGEWVLPEPKADYRQRLLKNVRTAVRDLRCHGIGHAIPLADDDVLVAEIVARGVRVAGCPLSNRDSGLIGGVAELGIRKILAAGVIYTLNADDDLLFPGLAEVADECHRVYGFSAEECRMLEENIWRGAFAPDADKYARKESVAVV